MRLNELNAEQKKQYEEQGYLMGLPVFTDGEAEELNLGLAELSKLLQPGESHFNIRSWHNSSKWLYGICTHPQILAYVEGLLGPDFFLWGSHFFSKAPHSADTVAWHQDAPYWPLEPHHSATVWIAFLDADEENAAMKVIPGTHRAGLIRHRKSEDSTNVLMLELDKGSFSEENAVSLNLKAGQISIHDDAMVHGSGANLSDRWRVGLTLRFSATDVKCDTQLWPDFKAHQVRGIDKYNLNPKGIMPAEQFARYDFKDLRVY